MKKYLPVMLAVIPALCALALTPVVVRQFAVPDMKRISFCLAQALRFGIAG